MSHSTKLLLGIATFWPIFYIIFFMLYVFSMMGAMGAGADPGGFPTSFAFIFVLHMLTILCTLGLMIYYLVHAIKDPDLDSNGRIVWVLVVVLAGMIGMPIYWWFRIWKRDEF